jgi:cytochrome c oxidase assembly factor CtaG
VTPGTLWSSWTWDPVVLLGLLLFGLNYFHGVSKLWRRAGAGHGVRGWEAACFAAGLAAIFIALDSPLDAMSLNLVSAHMVQHLTLIVVAAPLLALGRPHTALLWALRRDDRRIIGRWWRRSIVCRPLWRLVTAPLVVLVLHTAALWIWHLPVLYQEAVMNDGVHTLEHVSFLGTALLLWWTLVHPGKWGHGAGVLLIFVTGMQSVALGVLFTFSRAPWYPVYIGRTAAWGLTPLADQQLAGVIMWVPAGVIYLAAAAILFVTWMREMEAAMRRREGTAWPTVVPALPATAAERRT